MGIHYDYKSTRGAKAMEKQAKREKKLAEKKAKRLAKEGPKKEENKTQALDPNKPISLDFLTNPDKEWVITLIKLKKEALQPPLFAESLINWMFIEKHYLGAFLALYLSKYLSACFEIWHTFLSKIELLVYWKWKQ